MKSKKFMLFAFMLLLVSSSLLSGCTRADPPNYADDTGATLEGVQTLVTANNEFAITLYKELSANTNENVFFSPYSISTAFSLTYEGARGETANQLSSVFGFPQDPLVRLPNTARIYNEINNNHKSYELSTANALWTQSQFPLNTTFVATAERYYAANATALDFATDPEASRRKINAWVEAQTNGKIVDLLSEGVVTRDVMLILTNAIYFKATWKDEFDKKRTHDARFFTSPEDEKMVSMMVLHKDANVNYMENDLLQMVELPYEDEEFSMLVLLPQTRRPFDMLPSHNFTSMTLTDVKASLSAENLSLWISQLSSQEISVRLPKFTFETKYSLVKNFQNLGMVDPFNSDTADFSYLSPYQLYISDVIHQAVIEVDEKGTEAAAATVISTKLASAGRDFRADHPFIFLIKENTTGAIVFMGQVTDPTS
ncbi:MAG: serpin family protein [Candidatus Woesearchaeota archaeon]|nr:MAG: serpin family protein [Candidatus Woesearchaeota archaeon]